jgi:hypothetical protein
MVAAVSLKIVDRNGVLFIRWVILSGTSPETIRSVSPV